MLCRVQPVFPGLLAALPCAGAEKAFELKVGETQVKIEEGNMGVAGISPKVIQVERREGKCDANLIENGANKGMDERLQEIWSKMFLVNLSSLQFFCRNDNFPITVHSGKGSHLLNGNIGRKRPGGKEGRGRENYAQCFKCFPKLHELPSRAQFRLRPQPPAFHRSILTASALASPRRVLFQKLLCSKLIGKLL